MEPNPKEHLDLITSTILSARRQVADDSNSFILWGIIIATAALLHFVLLRLQNATPYIGWMILIPIGIAMQIWFVIKENREKKVHSLEENIVNSMWIAYSISLAIVLAFMGKLELNTYPVVLCLYGMAVFIVGGALKMSMFKLGGAFCWIAAVISFFVSFEMQLIILALAVIIAYLIPGILLKRKLQNNTHVA